MSKEQPEDDKAYIQLFNQNTKLSKRVKELEEDCEYLSHHYGLEAEQNKRYREAIEKAMSEMQTLERYGNENAIAAYVTLKEALEGNK